MEEKSQKIDIVNLLLIVCVIIIFSMGMIITNLSEENKKISNELSTKPIEILEEKSLKINEDKEFIYEKEKFEIEHEYKYQTGQVENFRVDIRIPFININSEDAQKINSELEKSFEEAKKSKKVSSDGLSFSYKNMNYESNILEGKILSILINEVVQDIPSEGQEKFRTYNFDLETGNLLSNEQVLKILNVENIDLVIKNHFTKEYNDALKDKENNINNYLLTAYDSLDKMLNDIEYDINTAYIFVSGENNIQINIKYYDVAFGEKSEFRKIINLN